MSDNKSIRNKMEKIFGKKCMIEESGIRYIPIEERRKIKGYKKFQEKITYHHIKEKQQGGKRSIENGALIKDYNHSWLHSLPEEEKEEINKQLQQYKLNMLVMSGNGKVLEQMSSILDFNMDDCIVIPVYDTKRKPKKLDRRKSILERQERKQNKHRKGKYFDEDDELEI